MHDDPLTERISSSIHQCPKRLQRWCTTKKKHHKCNCTGWDAYFLSLHAATPPINDRESLENDISSSTERCQGGDPSHLEVLGCLRKSAQHEDALCSGRLSQPMNTARPAKSMKKEYSVFRRRKTKKKTIHKPAPTMLSAEDCLQTTQCCRVPTAPQVPDPSTQNCHPHRTVWQQAKVQIEGGGTRHRHKEQREEI